MSQQLKKKKEKKKESRTDCAVPAEGYILA